MRIRGKRITIFVTVATALALAGCEQTDGSGDDPGTAGATLDQADLESVLVQDYPEGTVLDTRTTSDALAEGMLHPPPFVEISPPECAELLAAAAGDLTKLSGVVRWGQNRERRLLDALVATTPERVDIDRLRGTVENCRSGEVIVDSEGEKLSGTIELTEFRVPELEGVDVIGIQQTVTMDSESEMARMFELNGTSSQIYMGMDDVILVSCGDNQGTALDHARIMIDNVQRLPR